MSLTMMELKLLNNPFLLTMKWKIPCPPHSQTDGGFSEQDFFTPIIVNILAL
jgi:hypothetical protein